MNEKKYLDETGLSRFIQKIKSMFAPLSHTHTKSQITDFPSSLKNPSSLTFTGGVSGTYDGSSETVVEIPTTMKGATTTNDGASGLVTTPPKGASNRYLRSDGTWSVPPDTNTTYSNATTESDGLMSSDDKSKLDGIADGANNYIHPDYTAKTNGLYKVTIDEKGHVSETSSVTKADITALGIPGESQEAEQASEEISGIMKLYTSTGDNTDGTITQKTLTNALSGKAAINHDHTISNITDLQDNLDSKASKTHTHTISDVTALQSTLDGKASSIHTHDDRYYTETETDTKLAKKSDTEHKHSATDITSGTLDADRLPTIPVGKLSGVIDSSNLPSYVDDVLEYDTVSNFPKTGETGKIYVATSTNLTYRWSGTGYVEISPSLALGTTSSTAYRGDLGNTAYVHSQITSGNPHKVTKSDVGLGNVDNTADANKSVKYATSAGSADSAKIATSATNATNATTATKLATKRSIGLSGGASGAANFDGTANIEIPVNYIKESYLSWGGHNFSGTFGCIDAAMVPELGANRFAFGKAAGVKIEYSRDSGTTWTDYGYSNKDKAAIFSTGLNCIIGKADSSNPATAAYMLRVTIDTDNFGIYTVLNKFVIYVSTDGSTSNYCTIEASLESTPNTWVNFANKIPISGWSGYNVINTTNICTYGNTSDSQYGLIRFTFGCGSGGSSTYYGMNVIKIMGFGGVGWITPSTMAKYGRLYAIDSDQNATFPANVSATQFNGAATQVTGENATASAFRHVWFSNSDTESARVYSDKFQYNPSTQVLTTNINGSASSASTATTAAKLGRSGSTSTPMTFYWSGQSGQPTWLWGGTDGTNMYVYNPSNFSVNYASSAGNSDKLDGYHGSSSASASTYVLRDSNNYVWFNYINSNTSNSENPSISQVIVTNGSDNYYRKASLSHLKSSLGSMPASDVYSWAKASSKPSYSWSEISSKPSMLTTTEFEALFK